MKVLATLFAITATYVLPSMADGPGFILGTWWDTTYGPADGLKDITFPMSMANATHESGYYFMQSFIFQGVGGTGYTGLQPRPDSGSSSVVHAVFSSFVNGSTTDDANCHDGADFGPGVSCAVDINVPSYDHLYHLVVENTEGTKWKGTLVDTVTNEETHIGSYTLPSNAKGIDHHFRGVVEYFPWNGGQKTLPCDKLPWTQAYFGPPTTNTPGAGDGWLIPFVQQNPQCNDKVNFHQTETSDGGYITECGFK
ncbi:hypothetical protein O0I10_006359 [Lichtheimia ornata]|uniref:Uncharacterized protein n=1 Tax=Lichtheimia ornata TaxID=688661 RepID=A0AAD7Y0X9_9FUNG|nr:uncharacterized protein O0I10_006359 [Lichtheimia ornata]KAJ8657832.1 hypothetical protein O0I10_006359 [Lichtheimia ornata]